MNIGKQGFVTGRFTLACAVIGVGCSVSSSQPTFSTMAKCRKTPAPMPVRPGFTCGAPEIVHERLVAGVAVVTEHSVTTEHFGEYVAEYLYGGEFPIPCHWRPLSQAKELGEEIFRMHTVDVSGTAGAGGSVSSEVEAGLKLALAASAKTEAWAQVEITAGSSWQTQVRVVRKSFPIVYICSSQTLNVTRNKIHHVVNQPVGYALTWEFECKFTSSSDGEVAKLQDITQCWTGEYTAKGNGHDQIREVAVAKPIQIPCIIGPCPD